MSIVEKIGWATLIAILLAASHYFRGPLAEPMPLAVLLFPVGVNEMPELSSTNNRPARLLTGTTPGTIYPRLTGIRIG